MLFFLVVVLGIFVFGFGLFLMRVMQALGGGKSIVMQLIEERFCKQQLIASDACGGCMVMQTSAPKGKHPACSLLPSVQHAQQKAMRGQRRPRHKASLSRTS